MRDIFALLTTSNRDKSRNLKGGRIFIKRGEGCPTTYSGQFLNKIFSKKKEGGGGGGGGSGPLGQLPGSPPVQAPTNVFKSDRTMILYGTKIS